MSSTALTARTDPGRRANTTELSAQAETPPHHQKKFSRALREVASLVSFLTDAHTTIGLEERLSACRDAIAETGPPKWGALPAGEAGAMSVRRGVEAVQGSGRYPVAAKGRCGAWVACVAFAAMRNIEEVESPKRNDLVRSALLDIAGGDEA